MARVFSIQFTYSNSIQNALISVHENPFYTEYKITLADDDIASLLPNNKVLSTAPNQFFFASVASNAYSDLMKEILNAIAGHVHSFQH